MNIDTIRNEIAMDSSHKGINIIVEGATDAKLFEDFTDEEKCTIYQVKTRANVISLMEELAKISKNGYTLGIVDDDQNRLMGGEVLPPNTLYTDTNDIETMIFWSAAFSKIARHLFACEATPDGSEIKKIHRLLAERALVVGELRIVDKRKGWGLSFKDGAGKSDLEFKKFIEKRDMSYKGDDALIDAVKGHSHRLGINNDEAKLGLEEIRKEKHKPLEIVVGHDLTKVIALALKQKLGKKETRDFDREQVEVSFRLAYSLEVFKSSQLYKNINGMMAHHGIGFLL